MTLLSALMGAVVGIVVIGALAIAAGIVIVWVANAILRLTGLDFGGKG